MTTWLWAGEERPAPSSPGPTRSTGCTPISAASTREMEFAVFLPQAGARVPLHQAGSVPPVPEVLRSWTLWTPGFARVDSSWPASCCRTIRISDTQREGGFGCFPFLLPFLGKVTALQKAGESASFFWLCENRRFFTPPLQPPGRWAGKSRSLFIKNLWTSAAKSL